MPNYSDPSDPIYQQNQDWAKPGETAKDYIARNTKSQNLNQGSLQGTMPSNPAPSPTQPVSGVGMSDSSFLGLLNNLNQGFQTNNDYVKQKNAVVNAMLGQPVPQEQLATLPPDIQSIIQRGNRDQLMMQAQILNDQITGYGKGISSSIKYLTDTYQNTITQAEDQKQKSIDSVLIYSKALNQKPSVIIKALYPSLAQELGTQLDELATPLLTSTQVAPTGGAVSIPQSSKIAYENNNPFNIKDSSGKFIKYSTPDEGWQAGLDDVYAKMTGGSSQIIPDGMNIGQKLSENSTLEDMIRVYAPTSDGNDPVSYAKNIADQLGVSSTTKLKDLDPSQVAPLIAKQESGSSMAEAETFDPNPPEPESANTVDPNYGRTPNSLYQSAVEYAFKGGNLQQFVGGLSTKDPRLQKIKDYITNKAASITSAMGSSWPQLQAMYKANASAATKFVTQTLFIKTYLATATDNLDLALAQSDKVGRTGAKFVNKYALWAKGEFTPAGPLATLETYIYTAAREYAKVTGGGAMSAAGLTDSARKEAENLLNAAQSPEAFKATVNSMKADMANVVKELDKTVTGLSSSIGLPTQGETGTYEDYLKAIGQ